MDNNTLQRLLIDRSLGELTPDASALLDDYMQARPETSDLAADIESTIAIARGALTPKHTEARLPPLSNDAIRAVRGKHDRPYWLGPLAMAACIMLAFWLGGRINTTNTDVQSLANNWQSTKYDKVTNEDNFWSLRRLTTRTNPTQTGQNKAIQWSSPVAWPQIGDRS